MTLTVEALDTWLLWARSRLGFLSEQGLEEFEAIIAAAREKIERLAHVQRVEIASDEVQLVKGLLVQIQLSERRAELKHFPRGGTVCGNDLPGHV